MYRKVVKILSSSSRENTYAGEKDKGKQVAANLLAIDRKSTRLNSSHIPLSRMPSSA